MQYAAGSHGLTAASLLLVFTFSRLVPSTAPRNGEANYKAELLSPILTESSIIAAGGATPMSQDIRDHFGLLRDRPHRGGKVVAGAGSVMALLFRIFLFVRSNLSFSEGRLGPSSRRGAFLPGWGMHK